MQIYDFLCHIVFIYIYPLCIQLSHCHIYPQLMIIYSSIISPLILHSLICRVLLLLLLRNASDLRNCTSYVGACMWVWYCRLPIGTPPRPTRSPAIGGETAFTYCMVCGSSFSQCDGYDVGISHGHVQPMCRGRRRPAGRRRRPRAGAGPHTRLHD